jgi:hypothetical protein
MGPFFIADLLLFFEKTQKAFAFHFIEKKEGNIGLSVTTRGRGQNREQAKQRKNQCRSPATIDIHLYLWYLIRHRLIYSECQCMLSKHH